ncbi:Predicted RNA-binding protein, contains TRAM domain [Halorubrum aquaticum]|uniref:Predicted RNA-binding protein, contains TRAM domain n=1 Tax=Halorubrum aquaticum TaxID=387340 RepID=A0A1I2YZS5_9EURY|nr:TRAM domain-containing protein [Halorubrum aquaticum]SFH31084.1 Predicted RNA-binding protein, contains TRAM domain [Halorubrum aquaticum]
MVEITESLTCLFTAELEADGEGGYVVSVPKREIEHGAVTAGETYRVAVIERDRRGTDGGTGTRTSSDSDGSPRSNGGSAGPGAGHTASGPPVEEGEVRDVTIETLGDKGDGIAKIERGYVVIVPDAGLGDEVTVEITSVRENVSFASVLDD